MRCAWGFFALQVSWTFACRWQNTVGPEFLDSGDVGFDLYNMLVNFCLWHLRAAALNTINDPLVQLNESMLWGSSIWYRDVSGMSYSLPELRLCLFL
jgi:hypothetical protein